MEVEITITADTEDPYVEKDVVKLLETMLPYIFDNVVVTSRVLDEKEKS